MTQEWFNGPDQVVPADNYTTTDINDYVKLRIPESGKAIELEKPTSVPGLLNRTVAKYPNHIALAYKSDDEWKKITYSEYLDLVRTCAKAFVHLGLEKRHGVCILGFNSPEWFISDLAAIFAGGVTVGIYTTNSADACLYCAQISNANIIVVEDDTQLEKITQIRSKLPKLKAIVQYHGEPTYPDVISWQKLIEMGKALPDDLIDKRLKTIAVNQCCTIVFTSGTVGNPKAVMLSHDNFIFDSLAVIERIDATPGSEVIVSYLPLSHVAAQVVDIYLTISLGMTVYFADKDALKGSLINTLQEVQPTKFLAVPRVWEKIHESMQQVAAKNSGLKKAIASWAKSHALTYHLERINGNLNYSSWGYSIASSLIFKKIKLALGLNRCTFFCSAAAPLSADLKRYFLSIDIPIMEAFGMSEAGGAHTISTESATNLETLGLTLPGMKTKIYNPDESGQGELCMHGRHIFMGYMNEPEKTQEALDDEGWLHTGDLGKIDKAGFVYITGRLKELLITAGGENIPPVPIEQDIKTALPYVSNAFLVGDRRKFLSVLLTLKTKVDFNTNTPLNKLLPSVQDWLRDLGCPASTVDEVLRAGPDAKLLAAIQDGINKVNEKATSNAQKIQKFSILPVDFSIPTGELGPTLKVKRRIVEQKYEDVIEKLYQ